MPARRRRPPAGISERGTLVLTAGEDHARTQRIPDAVVGDGCSRTSRSLAAEDESCRTGGAHSCGRSPCRHEVAPRRVRGADDARPDPAPAARRCGRPLLGLDHPHRADGGLPRCRLCRGLRAVGAVPPDDPLAADPHPGGHGHRVHVAHLGRHARPSAPVPPVDRRPVRRGGGLDLAGHLRRRPDRLRGRGRPAGAAPGPARTRRPAHAGLAHRAARRRGHGAARRRRAALRRGSDGAPPRGHRRRAASGPGGSPR